MDWAAANGGRAGQVVNVGLPTYPFQRQRYWPSAVTRRGDSADLADGEFWAAIEGNDAEALATVLRLPAAERSMVESLMPALSGLRRLQRSHTKFDSQLYRMAWEPVTATAAARPTHSGDWLVLVPPGFRHERVVTEVIEALSAGGGAVHRLQIDPAQFDTSLSERSLDVVGVVSFAPPGLLTITDLPVWNATVEAVAAEQSDREGDPRQAVLWDRPSMSGGHGGHLDLPHSWNATVRDQLRAVLDGQYNGDRLALRMTGVFARRVRPASIDVSTSQLPWQPDGSVLLAGDDDGPLAAALTCWLTAAGADVVRGTDVPTGVTAVVCLPDERGGAPGIEALRRLHEQTVDRDLSAFVVVSHAGAQLGLDPDAGRRAYGAFADALVRSRRADGYAGTSIGWHGAAATQVNGLSSTDPDDLVEALAWAVGHGDACVTLADLTDDLRATILNGPRHKTTPAHAHDVRRAVQAIGTSKADGERQLLDLVLTYAAEVLGFDGPQNIDADRNFREQGFESYSSVDLRNRLAAATDVNLPATALFDYPTPTALVAYLHQCLLGEQAASPETPTALVPADEPIAIVGMGCRFPGGADKPEQLWELMLAERDVISDFPLDRGWDLDTSGNGADGAETPFARVGGFVHDASDFDAEFFGISPREAVAMDPQQRLLLETCWEALEDAGIDPSSLRGSDAGVYAGITNSGYEAGEEDGAVGYGMTGTTVSVASGRVAY
ncbi:beta-ketoacyl synthase N-terminal-like domain-containing protein, partial [Streptomyces sp. NPDC058307]|uniref:beta-ketoacyl synthase N-terminal-like domain-containing protein n=1 Tax=Streptomyces sp. NPDC058307 TaxID=3346439 RepID=UPI0036E3610F